MAFKLKSGNTTSFKSMGSSPAKQKAKHRLERDIDLDVPREGSSNTIEQLESEYSKRDDSNKARKKAEIGKSKVDLMQHLTGVNKNKTGEKIEKRRTDYLKSLDESPAKQRVDPLDLGLLDEAKKVKVNKGLPKNFNTSGKDSWVKRSKEILKKSTKKGGKVLGKRATGVLGLLGAGTLNATATNPHVKKSEGEQIKNLLTKHKLKGGKK
jgi:hypothetical protein